MSFESKRAVLSYWRWVIQGKTGYPALISRFDFNELNITGKDTYFGHTTTVPVGFLKVPLNYASKPKNIKYLSNTLKKGCLYSIAELHIKAQP